HDERGGGVSGETESGEAVPIEADVVGHRTLGWDQPAHCVCRFGDRDGDRSLHRGRQGRRRDRSSGHGGSFLSTMNATDPDPVATGAVPTSLANATRPGPPAGKRRGGAPVRSRVPVASAVGDVV